MARETTVSASPAAGEQDDVHRPAADGEEAHPALRQEQPQQRGPDERQAHDDEPLRQCSTVTSSSPTATTASTASSGSWRTSPATNGRRT